MRKLIIIFFIISQAATAQGWYAASAEQNVFTLDPEEYGIVQGVVDSVTARGNRNGIKQAMEDAKAQGYKTFKAANIDAYFHVASGNRNWPFWEGIWIPAGLDLDFRENCTFRVFPNNWEEYQLFTTTTHDNISIRGGTYIGDRFVHQGGGQRGYLIKVVAGENILIDGVFTTESHGDGIAVSSRYATYHPDYDASRNVIISNSTLSRNRRQGLSLGDGYNIMIEKNNFLYNGRVIDGSVAASPMCAIDVEAQRDVDANNNLVLTQIVRGVTIRNNTEVGSGNASFLMHIGDDVLIQKNTVQKGIVVDYGSDIRVLNNTIIGDDNNSGVGINIAKDNRSTDNNFVEGNKIYNMQIGLNLGSNGATLRNNEFYNFQTGMKLASPRNALVEYNIFESSHPNSIAAYFHTTTMENLVVRNNKFQADRDAMVFVSANNGNNTELTYITGNEFIGTRSSMLNSNGIVFGGNTFNSLMFITGTKRVTFREQNIINSSTTYGIQLREGNEDMTIIDNTISASSTPVDIQFPPTNFTFTGNRLNGVLQN